MHRLTHSVVSLTQRLFSARSIPIGMLRVLAVLLVVLGAFSCTQDILAPDSSSQPESPASAILDGRHSGGNAHFFFLPPLAPQPTVSGVSDGNVSPTVLVCEWSAASGPGGQCTSIIAQFSLVTGTGSEVVRYDAAAQEYKVNWHTDRCSDGACSLDPTKSYRLRVLVAATELGYADIQVATSGNQLKNIATNEYIGLVDGRTLPIKFRIEQGAVSLVAPGNGASIGTAGGQIATDDGKVALSIPAGALSASANITIGPSTEQLVGTGAWSTPVELGPDGTQFATPVKLSLSYDHAELPEGVIPEALRMVTWVDDHWEEVPGSVLNPADGTVSAEITHFSTYALGIWPNAVTSGVSGNFMLVGQSTSMTGLVLAWQTYPARYCYPSSPIWFRNFSGGWWYYPPPVCYTYTSGYYYYPSGIQVRWSSSAPGVAAVASPATSITTNGATTSPLVTASALGSTTITAQAGNLISTALITVATPPVINPFPQAGQQLILPVVPGTTASVDAPINNLGGYPLTGLQVVGPMRNCYTSTEYSWITTSFTPGTTAPTNLRVTAAPPADTPLGVYDICFTLRGTAATDRSYGTRVSVQEVVVPNPPVIDPFPQAGFQNIINVAAGATISKDVPIGNAGGGTLSGLTFVGPVRNCNNGALITWLTYAWASTTAPTTLTLTAAPPVSVPPGQYDLCFEIQSRAVGAMDRSYGARVNVGAPVPLVFSVFGTGTDPFRKFGFRQGTGLVSIIPVALAAPLTVSFTHSNVSVANTTNPTATIATGNRSEGATVIAGTVAGRDTVIGTAPGYAPDTLVIETGPGRIFVVDWPASLAYGDSAAIRIRPMNQDSTMFDNAWLTSFALSSNGNLSFSRNSVPITSIAVPDGSSSTPVFYVKAIAAGGATMIVMNSWYMIGPYELPIVGGFVSIGVSPDPAGAVPGGTVQLTGTPRNSAGDPVSGIDLSWSSANTGLATVDGNGLVTGVGTGSVIVTASSGGISGSATVRVGTPSISAAPGSLTLPVQQGQTAQAQINITNGGGGVLSGLQSGSFSNYFNGSPAPWVTASWNTTTAPATLTITAAPGLSIPAGVHQLRFDVSAPGASNSPFTFYSINITVIAAGVAPVNATISPTPGSLAITVALGQSAQAQIAINNSGTVPLTNLAAGSFSNYFNGSPAPWVTASFNTTTAPATLTITAAPGVDVPLGTHRLRFEVISPGATNSPYSFYSINVTVTEPPFRLGSIDGAGGFTCATTIRNAAYCWGSNGNVGTLGIGVTNNTNYPTPMAVVGGLSFTTASTDAGHTCALTPAGAAYCWGYGSDTRLGTGIDQGSNVPVAVAGGHTFVQIDVGDNHACAVDNLQRAYCWGYGMLGNLANTASASSRGNSSVPTLVLGGVQFLRVAAGGNFSCGIATNQAAYCWGLNSVGQLGAPSPTTYNCDPYICSLTPTAVSGGLQFQSVTVGSQHACGVTTGSEVYCWGGNGSGQLGEGSTINIPSPVRVSGVTGATQVDAGNAHTCARTGSGQLYCWGDNSFGQLGRGTQVGSTTAGLVTASGISFSRVTAGGSHSCAITSVGSAYCWGANTNGQLGIGSVTSPRTVPTIVAVP